MEESIFSFLSYRKREPLAPLFLEQDTLGEKMVLMAFQNKDELLYRNSHKVMWEEKQCIQILSKCLSPPEMLLDSALFVLPLSLQSQDIFSAGSTQGQGSGGTVLLMIQHNTLVATGAHGPHVDLKWAFS